MPDPTTTLEGFGDAVVASVRAYFGNTIQQTGLFDPQNDLTDEAIAELKTPAIHIAIDGCTVTMADDGMMLDPDNRVPFDAQMTARCWLSDATDRMPLRLAEFSGRMAALVMAARTEDGSRRGNRWGLGDAVHWPTEVSTSPSGIALHGRAAWDVTWVQRIYTDEALP
jgi:hypothetical protein